MLIRILTTTCVATLLSLLLGSCAVHSVYIPLSQNIPLFGANKELQAVVYGGTNHVEIQAASNPLPKFGLAGNIDLGPGISIYDAAAGTGGHGKDNKWRWEAFAGYGYNSNSAFQRAGYNALLNKSVSDYEVKSEYDKYYIQSAFGYFGEMKMYKLHYSFSLSSRFSADYFRLYSFKELDERATQQTGQNVYIQNKVFQNSFLYLWEPCITNKVGMKNFSLVMQFQAFFPYSQQIDIRNTAFSTDIMISIGLQYRFIFKHSGDESKN